MQTHQAIAHWQRAGIEFARRNLNCLIRIVQHVRSVSGQCQFQQTSGETTAALDDRKETLRGQVQPAQHAGHLQNDFADQPVIAIRRQSSVHAQYVIDAAFSAQANQTNPRLIDAQMQQHVIQFTKSTQGPITVAELLNFFRRSW